MQLVLIGLAFLREAFFLHGAGNILASNRDQVSIPGFKHFCY